MTIEQFEFVLKRNKDRNEKSMANIREYSKNFNKKVKEIFMLL